MLQIFMHRITRAWFLGLYYILVDGDNGANSVHVVIQLIVMAVML